MPAGSIADRPVLGRGAFLLRPRERSFDADLGRHFDSRRRHGDAVGETRGQARSTLLGRLAAALEQSQERRLSRRRELRAHVAADAGLRSGGLASDDAAASDALRHLDRLPKINEHLEAVRRLLEQRDATTAVFAPPGGLT